MKICTLTGLLKYKEKTDARNDKNYVVICNVDIAVVDVRYRRYIFIDKGRSKENVRN